MYLSSRPTSRGSSLFITNPHVGRSFLAIPNMRLECRNTRCKLTNSNTCPQNKRVNRKYRYTTKADEVNHMSSPTAFKNASNMNNDKLMMNVFPAGLATKGFFLQMRNKMPMVRLKVTKLRKSGRKSNKNPKSSDGLIKHTTMPGIASDVLTSGQDIIFHHTSPY